MNIHPVLRPAVCLAALLCAASTGAQAATSYRVDALSFIPRDINSSGTIVGWNIDSLDTYVYKSGVTQKANLSGGGAAISDNGLILSRSGYVLDTKTGLISVGASEIQAGHSGIGIVFEPTGINNDGTIVGTDHDYNIDSSRALAVKNGVVSAVVAPDGNSVAMGLNNKGDIVGSYQPTPDVLQPLHAARYQNGALTDLGLLPGGISSFGIAINEAGQVIGNASTKADFSNNAHAFLAGQNGLVDLGTFAGDEYSSAGGINGLGEIVGSSGRVVTETTEGGGMISYSRDRAFIYKGNGLVDLNTLLDPASGQGWVLERAYGISDTGIIFGWGKHNGAQTNFVLTAVPEAEAGAMLVAGLAVVALARRPGRNKQA